VLRTRFELSDALKALGMRLPFVPGAADLSGIAGRPGELYIKAVTHEAYMRVDEAGTEAAAATGAVVVATAAPAQPPIVFEVNRPFVFVLRDTTTGAIVFLGAVSKP
jgi:serpin B